MCGGLRGLIPHGVGGQQPQPMHMFSPQVTGDLGWKWARPPRRPLVITSLVSSGWGCQRQEIIIPDIQLHFFLIKKIF